jgi:hypothetical protein
MTSSRQATWLTVRYGRHRLARPGLAAERRPGYAVAAEHRPDHESAGADVRPDRGSQAAPIPAGAGAEGAVAADVPRPVGEPSVEADAPFGLPVLAELPELTAVLDALVSADERLLDAVLTLSRLVGSGEVERTTGVGVEQWLGIVARQTRMDRRLLLRLCRLLGRFPTLKAAVAARQVSFAQLRGLGLALRQAPTVDRR